MGSVIRENEGLTRRSFIRGAAAIGGTVAAAGLLSACSNETAAVAPSGLPETWDYEADVVIVGYGGAGAAAAWEALSAGSSTLILERFSKAGGSTNICGGFIYLGGGTPLQKALGFEDTPDNYYNYMVASGGPGVSEEHCRVLADSSVDLYDWLVNTLGVVFNESFQPRWPEAPNYDAGLTCSGDEYSSDFSSAAEPMPRGHWVFGYDTPEGALTGAKNGSGFFQPLLAAVEAMGPEVLYNTPATRLVYHSELDRVVGVVAESEDGEVFVKANKAVILTAGGFAKNEEMVKQYCPEIIGSFVIGTEGDDGKGIRIGQGVGGDVAHMQDAYGNLTCDSLMSRDSWGGGPLSFGILVNQRGQRFFSEDHYHSFAPIAMRTPYFYTDYSPAYLVCDNDAIQLLAEDKRPSAENKKLAATADTIEALAAAIGTPAGALEATVAYYNEHAAKGEDPVFGKWPAYIKPIATPPFFAVVASSLGGTFTFGGLKINTNAQVISALTQEPIAGLYSAGRNANDVIATNYQGSGTAIASNYTFGRIAGKNAAAEASWAAAEE